MQFTAGSALSMIKGARKKAESHSKIFAFLGIVFFLAFGYYSVSNFPFDEVGEFSIYPLLISFFVLVPAMIIANSIEFRAQGEMVSAELPLWECIKTTVNASIANILPIPGSVLVRIERLSRHTSAKKAAGTTFVAGVSWVGTSFVAGSLGLLLLGYLKFFILSASLGSSLVVVGFLGFRQYKVKSSVFFRLVLSELLLVVFSTANFVLVCKSIGFDVEVSRSIVINMSGPIASSVGIFPSGIGVAEGVASGLGEIVGVPVEIGFLATALIRLLNFGGIFLIRIFSPKNP